MKNAIKIMAGSIIAVSAGIISYTLINKKTRKKAEDLTSTMYNEMKNMIKDQTK